MKLRNKKTGEIMSFIKVFNYDSLAELNDEWEDYEEPKVGYIIDPMEEDYVSTDDSGYEKPDIERAKELGIWVETREEAEKAVEKLKAWKRLKDNGFRFQFWSSSYSGDSISFFIDWINADSKKEIEDDLDLLFGGEE